MFRHRNDFRVIFWEIVDNSLRSYPTLNCPFFKQQLQNANIQCVVKVQRQQNVEPSDVSFLIITLVQITVFSPISNMCCNEQRMKINYLQTPMQLFEPQLQITNTD
ncbi:Hypothetical_protein [Hexamita inflata]|uniref:Hypothetical_protein n=1 Tax=Hexamita inflata TaxID=28002 RepID=A0AA86NBY2_9EUKA|nr:Hypothetical protein HINF_LOCUS3996 [Hexamita inflata]